MSKALIGSTGFVGGTLSRQTTFDDFYNSKNIESIRGKSYELVICAGAPAAKWIANRNPEADLANLNGLMENLRHVRADRLVLVSTVDVYAEPKGVDEETAVDPSRLGAYGRNRFLLERFVNDRFPVHTVVRLPALFGTGLKKNFIFDLMHGNALHLTHCESVFQFYDLSRLWKDLQASIASGLPLLNFATAPVRAGDVANRCFGIEFSNVPENPPAFYDMRSRFTANLGGNGPYLYSAEEEFARITDFVAQTKA